MYILDHPQVQRRYNAGMFRGHTFRRRRSLPWVMVVAGICPGVGTLDASQGQETPQPPPLELARCVRLIQQGQYDAASLSLTPMVAAFPSCSRAHLLLGLTHHKQRHYNDARPLFARALELDPNDAPIRMYYGWCLYYLGESAEARKQFESFLATSPDYTDAHFALGLLDFDADDLDSATRRFAKAIELSQKMRKQADEAKARARLGDVHVRTGRLTEARRELERAVELNPDLYAAYFKLSVVLERLGDPKAAEQARTKHDEVRKRLHPDRGHAE